MKIRTITAGLPGLPTPEAVSDAGRKLERLADHFQTLGYTVQSRRICFERWEKGLGNLSAADRSRLLGEVDLACAGAGVNFCSAGMAGTPDQIASMAEILAASRNLSGCAGVSRADLAADRDAARAAAEAIVYLSTVSGDGFGNFRFGAGCGLAPGTPFFPGSYHDGDEASFSIGFENSDILVDSFSTSGCVPEAGRELLHRLIAACGPVAAEAEAVGSKAGIRFRGLDTSIAPSLDPAESVAKAFSALGTKLGSPGTLALCSLVTAAVKSVPVARAGYCGIMLPVLEDPGLAAAVTEGRIGVDGLLAWSSVCGVGIDMVPVAGDTPVERIAALITDVAAMSSRLNKPLSVRVLPIQGKRAGEMTEFDSPYVCNAAIMFL